MATRLLIVKLSSMGDVVHTLPSMLALRAAHPDAHLGWAVERAHAALLARQPALDELIVWDRRDRRTWFDFAWRLRRTKWDVAIDFQGLLRSALVARLSGAPHRIGYAARREGASWFYNDRRPLATMDRHAVERNLELAAAAGARADGFSLDRPYLTGDPPVATTGASRLFPLDPSVADRDDVDRWCREHEFDFPRERLVILNPHCRKDANRWPAPRFSQLAARLLERPGIRVALSGGPVAKALCDEIAAPLGSRVWRADGRFGLLGTTELLRRSSAVVTGDTGPMHLAVAAGAPVVALFGPANPLRTGPYASDAVVLNRRLECAPCFARHCPLHFDPPRCMDEIPVETVFRAVLDRCDSHVAVRPARKSA